MALTSEAIEKINDEMQDSIRELQAQMIEKTFSVKVMWCPHCDEMIREGEICNSCNKVIESGIPACKECEKAKIYHDERQEYYCPFHQEES